jgi:hypothetical protein
MRISELEQTRWWCVDDRDWELLAALLVVASVSCVAYLLL